MTTTGKEVAIVGIKAITSNGLRRMGDREGLILQGCGGDQQEWLDGINEMFTANGILKDGTKFENISVFEHEGLTCLLFPFDGVKLDVGKLALWRLQTHATLGGTWLSDYVPNRLGCFFPLPARPTEQPEATARPKPKSQSER